MKDGRISQVLRPKRLSHFHWVCKEKFLKFLSLWKIFREAPKDEEVEIIAGADFGAHLKNHKMKGIHLSVTLHFEFKMVN